MPYAKSEKTQRRLIQSTAKLLRARGYSATGVSAIVDASGVPKGSLYHHFPGGKEELSAAAVRFAGDRMITTLTRIADRAPDPVRAVSDYIDHYIMQLRASGFQKGSPLATVALEAAAEVDVVHEACTGAFDDIVDEWARRFALAGLRAQRAADAALFVTASIEGALVLAKARRDTRPIEIVREQLTELLAMML